MFWTWVRLLGNENMKRAILNRFLFVRNSHATIKSLARLFRFKFQYILIIVRGATMLQYVWLLVYQLASLTAIVMLPIDGRLHKSITYKIIRTLKRRNN